MITFALCAGLAGFWLWSVLNDEEGIARPLHRLLDKNAVTRKWMTCPLCSGAWFSGGASLAVYHPSWVYAIVCAIAAAGVTAVIAIFTGD